VGAGVYEVASGDGWGKACAMVALGAEQPMQLHHEPVPEADYAGEE
jgi:hypothetical protein